VRRSSEYQSMVFPRMLALAERSWHKADWEQSASGRTLDDDWTLFANRLGHHELRRLDALGIAYRVPPPGARLDFALYIY
jgi:hexosaminidase